MLVLTLMLTLGVNVAIEIHVFFPSVKANVDSSIKADLGVNRPLNIVERSMA